MKNKIKNLIIFVVIGAIIFFVYKTFMGNKQKESNLTTSPISPINDGSSQALGSTSDTELSKDFLAVLLSIQNITLDDSIFSDVAFNNLKDSTIFLVPDGTEGRPNPFAPIGVEKNTVPASVLSGFGTIPAEDDLLVDVSETPNPTPTTPATKPTTPTKKP